MNMHAHKTLIFISWSKPLSKQLALLLKDFLNSVFDLKNEKDIFVSSQNLTGNGKGWIQEVLEQASVAPIIIPCITKDSIRSPWLHFETGIGMSLKSYPTKIIPFLFNININEVNLEMYKFHQMVHSDKKDSDAMFKELLCQLIYYISTFLIENKDIIDQKFGTSFCCHDYESLNTNKISGHYRNALKKAVKELKEIKIMYETQDFYISRPMQGISPKDADVYETVLSDMVKVAEKKSFRCFYGKKFSEQDTLGISFYRMGTLKESQNFILIYPKISGENIAPSSCLIELGGALAYVKHIVLFIQYGAKVPAFIDDLLKLGYQCYYYSEIDDLKTQWNVFLNEYSRHE